MNVLVFVTTMLMLLSIMTYARLESYRNSHAFQLIFKHHVQEKGLTKEQADVVYKTIKTTEPKEEGQKKDEEQKKSPRVDASPRVAIGLLFDPKRESQVKDWEQTKILLKKLIVTLYKNQPFYKEAEANRPGFVDELISSITQEIDKLPPEKLPKKTKDLANLYLPDSQLNSLLYKILHGATALDIVLDESNQLIGKSASSNTDNFSEDDIVAAEPEDSSAPAQSDEHKSPEGYYSLLDYVAGRKTQKIRIYLAPRSVLLTIFNNDPGTVNNIINERERLYQQAVNSDQLDHLNETFKSQFEKMRDPAIDEASLNFTISKTNPKYYR